MPENGFVLNPSDWDYWIGFWENGLLLFWFMDEVALDLSFSFLIWESDLG